MVKYVIYTCIILPEALYADDVRLQVWFCGFDINIVSHMVHVVLEAAVLAVVALQGSLPSTTRCVLTLLSLWRSV